MVDGLDISEDEFIKMKWKAQNLILFRNINEIRRSMNGYKLYYKLTAIIGSILASGMGYLFIIHIGGK